MNTPARYFNVNNQAVRVTAPDDRVIASLRSFFDPYIPVRDEAHDAYDLTAVVQPDLYDEIKSSLPSTPDEISTTALQHDLEYELRIFHSEGQETTVIEDEPLKLFYVVSNGLKRTKIVATDGSRVRTGLLRIIRGAWVLGQPGLIVHGCALEKDGRGIIVSGEKYAGKTTMLLNLCLREGYNIVANDRLLLHEGRAKGIPTVVKLRPRTLEPFPELKHLIDVPLFGVSDLARALGVEIKTETMVETIAFLTYDPDVEAPVVHQLEDAHATLATHLFSRSEYDWVRLLNINHDLNGVRALKLASNERHLDLTTKTLRHN